MKRIIFILLLLVSTAVHAEQKDFIARQYAYASLRNNSWEWSDWLTCNVKVHFYLESQSVIIESNTIQSYRILSRGEEYIDNLNARNICFSMTDQDGDDGTLRLRLETNGNLQLYIEFYQVRWVYNLK